MTQYSSPLRLFLLPPHADSRSIRGVGAKKQRRGSPKWMQRTFNLTSPPSLFILLLLIHLLLLLLPLLFFSFFFTVRADAPPPLSLGRALPRRQNLSLPLERTTCNGLGARWLRWWRRNGASQGGRFGGIEYFYVAGVSDVPGA